MEAPFLHIPFKEMGTEVLVAAILYVLNSHNRDIRDLEGR